MKHGVLGVLAQWIMRCAGCLMPREREGWATAMRNEFDTVAGAGESLTFALGCVLTAISEYAHTRRGLALIGRVGIATCLFSLSVYGIALVSKDLATQWPVSAIAAACVAYMGAGVAALCSARALRAYAVVSLLAASLMSLSASVAGVSTQFLEALTLEFGLAMAALALAATYLSLLYSPDRNDEADA